MREFKQVTYWLTDFIELKKITKEVYGIEYDLQMGERSQGEYEVHTIGDRDSIQGTWVGMGTGYGYEGKYIEGAHWEAFGMENPEIDERGIPNYNDLDEDLNTQMAIDKWVSQIGTEGKYGFDRPFDKVGENGEYTFYQPDLDVVMNDLYKRGEIPDGTYHISIDW